MRILHLAASVAIRDGGAATAIENTNRALAAVGADSLVLTTDADGPTGRLAVDTRVPVDRDGSATWFCRRSAPDFLKNSWSMGRRALARGRGSDVMHVHGVYLANSVYAYLVGLVTGTPYVVQPHGTLEPYQQAVSSGRKRMFNRVVGDRIIARAARVVATAESEAANVLAQYPAARLAVVPLGVAEHAPVRPADATGALHRWLAAPAERRVIFLGRLATKKRPELLARAWFDLDDAQLLFVGPEQDWTPATLRPELGDPAGVGFLPTVDPAGVAWCLAQAGVFVLPSENENFGISVVEAMFHGCAVVTTGQTAASEHVLRADAGVVLDHPSAEAVHLALVRLLADPTEVRKLGARGAEHARASLSWDSSARELLRVYAEVTAERTGGRHGPVAAR